MSLSLEKVQQRQRKKVTRKKSTAPTAAPQRPWQAHRPAGRRLKGGDFAFSESWFDLKLETHWWPKGTPLSDIAKAEKLIALSEQMLSEGQNRIARWKKWIEQPKTFKFLGLGLEIGPQPRLHLPALRRKRF